MLQVNIEKIIPVTEARDMFNKIIDDVEGTDELYVLTKNGKPAAVVVGVNHLEKLTGESHSDVVAKIDSVPFDKVASEIEAAPETNKPESDEEPQSVFASADDTAAAASANQPLVDITDYATDTDIKSNIAEPLAAPADNHQTETDLATAEAMPAAPAPADLNPSSLDTPAESNPTLDNTTPLDETSSPSPSFVPSAPSTDPFVPSAPPETPSPADTNTNTADAEPDDNAGPILPPRQDY